MVMPFRERTVPSPPKGAPATIDCDALWDKAFRPALEDLGYLAIRADIEIGSVIVKDMLERLALAELVLADLTLPNGNVYYEVGLRHVARRTHCVLIAADWSQQLFDTDQIRTDRYPLKDGRVPDKEAEAIRRMLLEVIPKKKHSPTPYYELVTGKQDSSVFREQIAKISEFQAQVRALRLLGNETERQAKVRQLCDQLTPASFDLPEVALELIALVRDSLGWEELMSYVDKLPTALQNRPFIREQIYLAQSNLGDHQQAIAGLNSLIQLQGESPERRGLIGGRYKRLWRKARKNRRQSGNPEPDLVEIGYLDSAIENYTIGMELDYNEFYCANNLPALLRARSAEGDEDQAAFLDKLVVRTCERKLRLGQDDGWTKPALLGAAFRSQDVLKVRQLAVEVARQGAAAWQLDSTLDDIADTIEGVAHESIKAALGKVRDQLKNIAHPG
jgi:hypothetical protein